MFGGMRGAATGTAAADARAPEAAEANPWTRYRAPLAILWTVYSAIWLLVACVGYAASPSNSVEAPEAYLQGADGAVKAVILGSLNLFAALLLYFRKSQVVALLLVLFVARLAFVTQAYSLPMGAWACFAALLYGFTSVFWLPLLAYALYLKRCAVLR